MRSKIKPLFFAWAACLTATMLLFPSSAFCGQWDKVAAGIGKQDAAIVYSGSGEILYSKNGYKPLIPASTLKLLTALAAISTLGENYRFETEFYRPPNNDLVIKGYGDPLLVSEQVSAIAEKLAGRISSIRDIVLDDSYFKSPVEIPGAAAGSIQPYDAPVGALCVNFNTVNFKKEGKTYLSAEPQTPMLPTAVEILQKRKIKNGRILLPSDNNEYLLYAGELFAHFFKARGIEITGNIRPGLAEPEKDRLVYRYKSPYLLTEVISMLMEYSSNFIANQILVAAGAEACGPPGTLEKGVGALCSYAKDVLGISPAIAEGSGISRQNRMTAEMFVPVLNKFAPYRDLLPEKNGLYCKTGTLEGVETRAGYIEKNGKLYGFAVLINTPDKSAERVVKEIKSIICSGALK
ncbi:MAG: D-alanyl-D-alanine carboxypeptidase [Desulfobacterales bacterium]|nr:D-alanyl-D-alanine carboxypeptidase [Desulfobacterales bacterium]